MANVKTGFSEPYVALYSVSGSTVTYTSGQKLARGVSASLTVNAGDDNGFYADNILAETAAGVFLDGELTLTVDGLSEAAEKLIMGLPTLSGDWYDYGDSQSVPDVGIAFIVRTMYLGTPGWQAIAFPKCRFNPIGLEASTQEEQISWQTQELVAKIFRDDSTNHTWKKLGEVQTTEAAALTDIKTLFSITP